MEKCKSGCELKHLGAFIDVGQEESIGMRLGPGRISKLLGTIKEHLDSDTMTP